MHLETVAVDTPARPATSSNVGTELFFKALSSAVYV
jgi:hypothetical protein